ncbi:MAG: superoxide dismutase [Cu-Zn] SodC [Pseudomonadota bacterium]|nr:superoxide dismutase [Cu-Zn] SodC [Pseudomonadota bacterium]
MMKLKYVLLPAALVPALASADITVQMNAVTEAGVGESIGTIVISKATHGIVLTPELTGLPPGEHGFHVHEVADCSPARDDEGDMAAAHAAGDHYDPEGTMMHGSPLVGDGHLGDLPVLVVGQDGRATEAVEASRLSLEDVGNRALMIHAGGDNYSDVPEKAGGGGARIACGIIDSSTSETELSNAADPQLGTNQPTTQQ